MEWLHEIDPFSFRGVPIREKRSETEYILREAVAKFKKPMLLWAGGKDSTTMLWIAKELWGAGNVPFPVCLLDTTFQYRETYDFMDKIAKEWKLDYRRLKNMKALKEGINPEKSKFKCCQALKTDNLQMAIEENGFDAVFVGIRWDEHGIRGKEQHFSRRADPGHYRVHPILHWGLQDVWDFIKEKDIPYNPLYDRVEHGNLVYKSIGCYPCTEPIPRDAAERDGRAQDKEDSAVMERLRALGYM